MQKVLARHPVPLGTKREGGGKLGSRPSNALRRGRIVRRVGSGIICSAFVANDGNAPPTSTGSLSVVKKTKQKGD